MDVEIIIGIVISIFIILFSVIFFFILFNKRNQFPYFHFNSFWERIILILVFINQIYCLIYNVLVIKFIFFL